MPLTEIIKNDKSSIGIWHLDENSGMLKQMLNYYGYYQIPPHYSHQRRICEWYAVRLILHEMLPDKRFELRYDEYGKPFLTEPEGFVSISHSHGYVGVMYHKNSNCGFDMEMINERIEKISTKFLRDDEIMIVGNDDERLHKTFVVWSAKEVMYKIYGKKSLDFKTNLRILPFNLKQHGNVQGQMILDNNTTDFDIHYSIDNGLLKANAIDR